MFRDKGRGVEDCVDTSGVYVFLGFHRRIIPDRGQPEQVSAIWSASPVFFFPSLFLLPRVPLLSPSRFGFARRVKQNNNQHSRPEEKDQTDRIGLCPDKS